jgi:GcrA cell cycle regulator
MDLTSWAPEHSAALREHLARGLTFSEIAKAINSTFKTDYSRNATIGRARRMGLAGADRPKTLPHATPRRLERIHEVRSAESRPSGFHWPRPPAQAIETAKLRCVEVEPRYLSLIELERGDCRYPYGGDEEGEAITFCGHPRRAGSSYCTPHFHLSRNPVMPPERAVRAVSLRIVEAA